MLLLYYFAYFVNVEPDKLILMGKNKKAMHSKKEEKQAEKVVKIVFFSLILLGIIMLVGFSFY